MRNSGGGGKSEQGNEQSSGAGREGEETEFCQVLSSLPLFLSWEEQNFPYPPLSLEIQWETFS